MSRYRLKARVGQGTLYLFDVSKRQQRIEPILPHLQGTQQKIDKHQKKMQSLQDTKDAFLALSQKDEFDAELFQIILDDAYSQRRPLYENATHLISRLTVRPQVQKAVLAMSGSRKAHIRFNAILCLSSSSPAEFTLDIIRRGLKDRSKMVRTKAADWILRLELKQALTDLKAALEQETDTATKSAMNYSLLLLRDGYILQDNRLTLRLPGRITTTRLSKEDLQKNIDELTEEQKKQRGISQPK